jgi:molecular chaperone DnaK
MHSDQIIIGIDLGTTNSVVAVVEGDEAVVIPNQEGSNKTPSVVAFLDNQECLVGEIARRQAATNPVRTVTSIKRMMGVPYEDLDDLVLNFPYEIVNHEDRVLINVDGSGYTPEQISALVLKKLKEAAESYLGKSVAQAVITVPAHFDDLQRNATLEAAQMAGLEVLRLINEPTAAALAYGVGKSAGAEEIIAVYDFGGGTFDITILEISNKTFEVLTSTGDNRLGGDDMDNVLVEKLVDEFFRKHQIDLRNEAVTLRRLKEVAEKAKIELSSTSQTSISLPFIAHKDGQPLHIERVITRNEFEDMVDGFIQRTVRCCKRALDDAGVKKSDIKKVILVGGSTRIPLVQDMVEDFFEIAPFKGINPDEVVALGAATQAGVFTGNIEEVTLLDVAPHSLGIEVREAKFSRIIEKNATIPIKAAKNFTTTEDNQTYVNIHILQGEADEANENRSLGKFTLQDIPPMPKGRARVRVTFFVNADGVMEISAEELGSGVAKSLTILHNSLDEGERKVRKKARQRRGNRREESSAPRRAARPSAGGGGGAQEPIGQPKRLPSRTRNVDSSIVPLAPEGAPRQPDSFEVLGDTRPGAGPTAPVHSVSSEANPLPSIRRPAAVPLPPQAPVAAPAPAAAAPIPSSTYGAPQRFARPDAPPVAPQAPKPYPLAPAPAIPAPTQSLSSPPTTFHHHNDAANTQISFEPPTDQFENDLPTAIILARAKALQGAEDAEAQGLYGPALDLFATSPWNNARQFAALEARALIQMMMGQLDEMRATLSTLVEQHAIGYPEKLEELFQKAISRFAVAPGIRRDRARLRQATGNLEGACEDLEFASKTDPREGDGPNLEELYRLRLNRGPDPAAQFKLVKVYLKTGRVDEAIELLQDLQHHEAYETRATKILGLCHWQKNLHFLAWQKFKQLKQTDEIRDILYRLGNDMEATGQLNNALTVYEHLAQETAEYRDVSSKIKKLRYRIKMHQDENDQKVAAVLSDPRFTILEEINRGSMGIIYKAHDKTLDEIVALKVLNDYLCADPSAVERFKREARAAKKLSHPYIVRIHDMFETGSKRFISMEYIEGTDLKRMLADRTSFSEDQLVYYFLQLCDAMSYAHKLNIIHRDIKPANIMITKDNTVKVTDFGIAKILKGDDSTKSGTAVIGTPLYMAPEQITGEGIDARSDIYALGIMMYELVSGQPPFYLGNIEYHHIHTAPPPLPEKVSEKLRAIIMRCVQKNPSARFQSIEEIYNSLR